MVSPTPGLIAQMTGFLTKDGWVASKTKQWVSYNPLGVAYIRHFQI
jgi:hypothetical protein